MTTTTTTPKPATMTVARALHRRTNLAYRTLRHAAESTLARAIRRTNEDPRFADQLRQTRLPNLVAIANPLGRVARI